MAGEINPPRYRFCWWCSRQLWGPGHVVEFDGLIVRVHRACLKPMSESGRPMAIPKGRGN
jgi:hypothetical protein